MGAPDDADHPSSVQVFAPILHEKAFADDLDAVFAGDADPYRHFVVNMVVAISLQKMGGYAGLPDSYYLRAMQHFEDVVRPKDLKTLQCLVLIGQYSLLTPTRTAIYYVIGLATRICQQMGLGDEKTIGLGVSDPLALDMRRRLSWIVTTQELGLAHSMGRPNGFAKGNDMMNVKFFETVPDESITPEGVRPGPPCERKLVAMYFCKMRLLQAEIRRVLYENKRPEPAHESHPWFGQMEQKLRDWLDACPEQPTWCKPWYARICHCRLRCWSVADENAGRFTGRYHSMLITLYRPSPQVPRPSSRAAARCFDGARYIIDLACRQIEQGAVDITWVFLLTIYSSLNALLWSISYPEVRAEHAQDEVQDLAATALETITACSDRWPGAASAVQLYTVLTNACLQSYNAKDDSPSPALSATVNTPASLTGPISPASDASSNTPTRQPPPHSAASLFNTSPFGYVFDPARDGPPGQFPLDIGPPGFQRQPTFRSNSIFMSPSTGANGRRLSHLAPDSTQATDVAPGPERPENTPPPSIETPGQESTPPASSTPVASLPTPPESLAPTHAHLTSTSGASDSLSPRLAATTQTASATPTPTMHPARTAPPTAEKQEPLEYPPPHHHHQQPQQQQHQAQLRTPPTFTIPAPPAQAHPGPATSHYHQQQQQQQQQRTLPQTTPVTTDWFSPPPPLLSPHAFAAATASTPTTSTAATPTPTTTAGGMGGMGGAPGAGVGLGVGVGVGAGMEMDMDLGMGMGMDGASFWDGAPNPFTGLGLSGNDGLPSSFPPAGGNAAAGAAETGWNFNWPGVGGALSPQHPPHPHPHPHSYPPPHPPHPLPPQQLHAPPFANANAVFARHGSLSHEQQLELMDVLETEGMQDIDTFLSIGPLGLAGGAGGQGGQGG